MGASSYFITVRGDRAAVEKAWKKQVAEDGRESGTGGYAGNATTMSGAIQFMDLRLTDRGAAEELIMDRHEKWSGPIAVSCLVPKAPTTADERRVAKAQDKLKAAREKCTAASQAARDRFWSRVSRFATCASCASKFSRVALKVRGMFKCPLCRSIPGGGDVSLLSAADDERIAKLAALVTEAEKALTEARRTPSSDQVEWVVGGWAAS